MKSILGLRRRTTHRSVPLKTLRRYVASQAVWTAPPALPAPALARTPSTVVS
jgi:hypothetical protein